MGALAVLAVGAGPLVPSRVPPSSGDTIVSPIAEAERQRRVRVRLEQAAARGQRSRSSAVGPRRGRPRRSAPAAVRWGVLPEGASSARAPPPTSSRSADADPQVVGRIEQRSRASSARGNGSRAPGANIDGWISRRPTPVAGQRPGRQRLCAVGERGESGTGRRPSRRRPRARRARPPAAPRRARPRHTTFTTAASKRAASSGPAGTQRLGGPVTPGSSSSWMPRLSGPVTGRCRCPAATLTGAAMAGGGAAAALAPLFASGS